VERRAGLLGLGQQRATYEDAPNRRQEREKDAKDEATRRGHGSPINRLEGASGEAPPSGASETAGLADAGKSAPITPIASAAIVTTPRPSPA